MAMLSHVNVLLHGAAKCMCAWTFWRRHPQRCIPGGEGSWWLLWRAIGAMQLWGVCCSLHG
jgi:hypothetical protein